jgi:hypothetical protein
LGGIGGLLNNRPEYNIKERNRCLIDQNGKFRASFEILSSYKKGFSESNKITYR